MSENSSNLCSSFGVEISLKVIESGYFQVSVRLIIFICAFSIFSNVLLIVSLIRVAFIQEKTKILLVNVSLANITLCMGEIVLQLKMVTTEIVNPISSKQCLLESLPKSISFASLTLSMNLVAWERVVATRNFRSHENDPKFPSICCAITSWLIPFLVNGLGANFLDKPNEIPLCFVALAYHPRLLLGFSICDLLIGSITLFIFVGVIASNRSKLIFYAHNQAQLNLSGRYQLRNNMEITKMLIPSVVLKILIYMSIDVGLSLTSRNDDCLDHKIRGIAIFSCLEMLYTLLHPVSIVFMNKKLRKQLIATALCCESSHLSTAVGPVADVMSSTINALHTDNIALQINSAASTLLNFTVFNGVEGNRP